jgi:hypothetical protein
MPPTEEGVGSQTMSLSPTLTVLANKKIPRTDATEFSAQRKSRVGIFPANAAASNTRVESKSCHFSSPFSYEIFVEERQLEGRLDLQK